MKRIKPLLSLIVVSLIMPVMGTVLGTNGRIPKAAAQVMNQTGQASAGIVVVAPSPTPIGTPVPTPTPPPSPTPTPIPVVALISPQPGNPVNGIAQVEATVTPATYGTIMFQYSLDGATWTPIAAEPIFTESGAWAVRWDTTVVRSGPVFLQAVFNTADGQTAFSQIVQVQLDQPPVPMVTANVQGNSGTVMFDGSQSHDPDGNIVQWIWDFGDGSGGSGSVVSHTYQSLGTVYSGSLTVVDNAGNTAYFAFSVNFVLVEVKPEDKCICTAIALRGQTPPQNALGPKGDGSKSWPVSTGMDDGKTLGPLSKNPENKNNYVGYAWEIAVDVDGDPAKCKEIQVAKRTFVLTGLTAATCNGKGDTWDGVKNLCTRVKVWSGTTKDLDLDGTNDIVVDTKDKCTMAGGTWDATNNRCDLTFPQSGAKYAPDEYIQGEAGGAYESPFSYKVHIPKKILWYDTPNVAGGNDSTGNWDFISLIRGTDGKYCYVAFSQSATRKAGAPVETIKQTGTATGAANVPGVP